MSVVWRKVNKLLDECEEKAKNVEIYRNQEYYENIYWVGKQQFSQKVSSLIFWRMSINLYGYGTFYPHDFRTFPSCFSKSLRLINKLNYAIFLFKIFICNSIALVQSSKVMSNCKPPKIYKNKSYYLLRYLLII